jgi:DNA-binding Xre family transcriptional regulator
MEKMDWQATVKQAHKEAAAAGIGSNSLERIQDAAEEAYDILCVMEADLRAVLGEAEYVPFSLAQRRFAGENPITVWREHRGMTQKALAAKVKMTAAQLSEIEKGKKSGSIATLRKLSIALGVTVDDLLPPEK